MNVIIEDKDTIRTVLMNEKWTDLEDGLQMQCALREELEYIVTRNIKDFQDSSVMPVLPEQLISLYNSRQ